MSLDKVIPITRRLYYKPKPIKRLFVLGAGCSVDCLGLLTKDLFSNIHEKQIAHFNGELHKFLGYLYPRTLSGNTIWRKVDIEDLLSTIDMALATPSINKGGLFKDGNLKSIKRKLIELVVRQLWVSSSIKSKDYALFASRLKEDDAVITFNYDTLLDREIVRLFPVPLERLYFKRSYKVPRFLKLHGSINWVFNGKDIAPLSVAASPDPIHDYAIVPPTLYKNPAPFEKLWNEARDLVGQATDVWFIGYSMPQLDIPSRYTFRRGIRMNLIKGKKVSIHVANPDSSILNKYCDYIHPEIDYKRATFTECLERYLQ